MQEMWHPVLTSGSALISVSQCISTVSDKDHHGPCSVTLIFCYYLNSLNHGFMF